MAIGPFDQKTPFCYLIGVCIVPNELFVCYLFGVCLLLGIYLIVISPLSCFCHNEVRRLSRPSTRPTIPAILLRLERERERQRTGRDQDGDVGSLTLYGSRIG
jgi:hypothetical protein